LRKDAIPVELEAAHVQEIVSKATVKGTVSFGETMLVYPTNQAIVKKVLVTEGDLVNLGDILAEYDEKALATLESLLSEAKLELALAKINLEDCLLPAADTDRMQAEAALSQAKKAATDLQDQISALEDGLFDLEVKAEKARKHYEEIKLGYTKGQARKEEVDAANWELKEVEASIKSVEMNRNALLASLPSAEENLLMASQFRDATVNKQSDPRVKSRISAYQLAVSQAEQSLAEIKAQVDGFAPNEVSEVQGIVTKVHVRDGEAAVSGVPLMELADTSNGNLVIRADVPESDAKDIKEGQTAELTGNALEGSCKANVRQVASVGVERLSETVLPIELVPEGTAKLKAGFSVDVSITTKTSPNAIVVPIMATVEEKDGSQSVFVLSSDYAVKKRKVRLGGFSGIYVQVDGVAEGELVVVNPPSDLSDGDHVNPLVLNR
jgi:multidrug efflux pump subunit AcrA (membrane-fusion protein)